MKIKTNYIQIRYFFNLIFFYLKLQPKSDKRRDDISEKLKELTGDWTEDENEDDEDVKTASTEQATAADEQSETEKQSVEVSGVAKEATEAAQPEPEDDIDLALESMHKGDDDVVTDTVEAVEAVATSSTAEVRHEEREPETEGGLKTEELSSSVEAAIKDESVAIKKELEKEEEIQEEFIKEDALQPDALSLDAEIKDEEEAEIEAEAETATAAEPSDDVNLETENIRKVLIDELIAEADAPEAEVVSAESVAATQLPEIDGSEALKDNVDVPKEVAAAAVGEAADQTEEKLTEATTDDTATSKAVEDASEVASDEKESDKPATTSDEASTTLDGKAHQPEQQLTGTQEKLKSLMSEWVDDDDDDNDNDDENGVSAAAKEQL